MTEIEQKIICAECGKEYEHDLYQAWCNECGERIENEMIEKLQK